MYDENNPYKVRETLTFSITKESFMTICKIAEKNTLITYLKCAIPLTLLAAIFLLSPFKWIGIGILAFTLLFSIVYFCIFFIKRMRNKKKLEMVEDNLYNYTIYPNHLIVTLKNDKHVFQEYVIPRRKAKAKTIEEFLSFYHRCMTFTIPMRTLNEDSLFLSLDKKFAK